MRLTTAAQALQQQATTIIAYQSRPTQAVEHEKSCCRQLEHYLPEQQHHRHPLVVFCIFTDMASDA